METWLKHDPNPGFYCESRKHMKVRNKYKYDMDWCAQYYPIMYETTVDIRPKESCFLCEKCALEAGVIW